MKAINPMVAVTIALALGGCALTVGGAPVDTALSTFEVFFDVERSDITVAVAQIVRNAADNTRRGNVSGVTISIHSGVGGWSDHSQALSRRRAESVKAELVRDGVPADEITLVEVAENHLAPTEDGVREPLNRRTEIILW